MVRVYPTRNVVACGRSFVKVDCGSQQNTGHIITFDYSDTFEANDIPDYHFVICPKCNQRVFVGQWKENENNENSEK